MELDEWELTAEEMEILERDALQKVGQQRGSASGSQNQQRQPQPAPSPSFSPSVKNNSSSGCSSSIPYSSSKVESSPRKLPSSVMPKPNNDGSFKEQHKFPVKFFLHASGNIAAKFQYNTVVVAAFRNIPKAIWNGKERLWLFPLSSLSAAEMVLGEITDVKVEVENLYPLVHRAVVAASAVPDLRELYGRIPESVESKLLPFQREGVRFVLQHGGRALLADEMGLGKTLQAIAVTTCVRESWPVLVLAPSSLRLHWASTIQQWLNIPSSDIVVVLSQSSGSNRAGFTIVSSSSKSGVHLDGLFNIISYDSVTKLQNVLMTSDFKVVIADECHFLKNAQAKRTTASIPVIKKAKYAILLSGTPALSRPIELFKQLEALYPDVYSKVFEYGERYCKGGVFGTYQGASNHEELHNLMKATVMIRRLKKDVLYELPQKRRQQVFLDLAEKDMKQINALFRELEVIKGKIKACESEEEAKTLKFTEKGLINKIYTESAQAKIPAVLDYLGTVVEAGCKFLVFGHHQPMIEAIHQFLLKKKVGCIRIDGNTPASTRQALVTDFQEKEAIKAAVLSIKAGGVGLTLTAASTVIFAELSWTPGDLIQAEDRAHRIGQVSSVNVYYLLANDTVDDIIWDVVQHKLDNLGQMLDGRDTALEVSASQPEFSPTKQKPSAGQEYRSPAKQKASGSQEYRSPTKRKASGSQEYRSPGKQKTLDCFIKRCNNSEDNAESLKRSRP